MKKYFLSLVAIAAMLFATSCQESLVEPQIEGPTTFTVQLPDQMGTKAIGDKENVNQLLVAVYSDVDNDQQPLVCKTVDVQKGTGRFDVSFDLIKGQTYDLIFWAQTGNAYVNGTQSYDLRTINIENRFYSNENGAAFYAYQTYVIDGQPKEATLRRPFAQLNIGTTVGSLTTDAGKVVIEGAKIKVTSIASSFNTLDGNGTGQVVYGQAETDGYAKVEGNDFTQEVGEYAKLTVGTDGYVYVSMDYLPVFCTPEQPRGTVDIELVIKTNNPTPIVHNFYSVPVQRNYRTNIVGNLISSTTDFNVVVDDKFVDENGDNVSDDYNMLIWDGESIKVPSYDDATKTYSISNGAELAWLAATVSGDPLTRSENEPNSLADKTVKLTDDIYLGENEWKPIGMGGKHFEGIFDGQGHTIYGLKVASRSSGDRAALFCSAAGSAQFKNFTIDGAKIIYPKDGDDYYAAGVVGTIYGNHTFEDITVKNSRITGNNKVAGLIAHDGKSTQITINNCHILDSYIASEDLKDGGCVGGMIGYYATGVEGKENNIYNSSVEGCTIVGVNSSNSGKRANSEFIGSIKTNADMVLNITDCILERNIFTQTINGTDPVTYLSAFNPQYIGGDREENTLGTITISVNGETPAVRVTTSAQLQHVVKSATTDITVKLGANITGNVTVIQKPGVKITIDGSKYKYNGSIKVHSNSNYYTDAALTIKNLNFETSIASVNFIEALENGSERYSSNITVENCTFTATGAAENTAVGVQIKASKNAKVIGCTATNMHSLIQATSCDESVLVQGSIVTGKNGVAFKQVKAATVEGTTIDALEYGIRFDGNIDNYGITVKGNAVTAKQPFIVRKMTGRKNTIALEETNTLTTTLTTEETYQIVITNGSDDEAYVKPTGTYTLTGAEDYSIFPKPILAKVGNTEYDSIDDAIAAWTNNTTLTLLADVTLSDVIKISSTEMHTLDLGTYTMTAAKGKDAIDIVNNGRSSASYALDIKADAINPGGITATSKAVVKTTGKSGVKDRPIIRFYNGVFNASNIISHSGSNGTNCPKFEFHNGVYNGTISANRAMIHFYGGTFNGSLWISVDSSAYALISGGKFKELKNNFGSALNKEKFTIGSAKGVFDRGVYVDDEGYIVVGGPVITEFGDKFAAKATNVSEAGSYLPYSSAAEYGLYYTNAEMAITKHGAANVDLK